MQRTQATLLRIRLETHELAKAFPDEMRAWVKQGVITKSTKPNFISFDYFKSDLMETIEYLNRL